MSSVMLTISATPETKERFRKLAAYTHKSQARLFETFVSEEFYKLKYTKNVDLDELTLEELNRKES